MGFESPTIMRSPRVMPDLPRGEQEIPAPPSAPTPPTPAATFLQSTAVALAGAAITGLITWLIMRRTSGGYGGYYWAYGLMTLPVMILSGGWQYLYQKRTYRRLLQERNQKYRALLTAIQEQLHHQWQSQRASMNEIDPDPAECLARVEHLDHRLWQRSPADADFLALRLGLGSEPFLVAVKTPRQPNPIETDPLYTEAQHVAESCAAVTPVPVRVHLRTAGLLGMAGPRPDVIQAVRSMLMHLATHHSPDEVKLCVLFPPSESHEWEWLRWLPHVWTDDRRVRLLASDMDGAHRLCMAMFDLYSQRRLAGSPSAEQKCPTIPVTVFVVADDDLIEREPLRSLLLHEGADLGAHGVFLADRRSALPKQCKGIVELGHEQGLLFRLGAGALQVPFQPDDTSVEQAEKLSRAMAPLRLQGGSDAADLPPVTTLLQLFDIRSMADLDVLARWREAEPDRTLAAPVGVRAGGEHLSLDVHEDGHGPHGLVAGATGSGKSELLQTLVASMAASYHPHDLVFVLIDFKGGALADDFRRLPHLAGAISNLSQGNMALRVLIALRAELRRRQETLSVAGFTSITDYQRAKRSGRISRPLPHLVVIIDEFAELKAQQPEFMRELVSAVRVGRSLGVHLILATQKPAGVVDEQIWGNARFRLCLRVERPEDSQEVLKRTDAAFLVGKGRAIFQVGNNERFEAFQVGWSGAPYLPGTPSEVQPPVIAQVLLDGRRIPLTQRAANAVEPAFDKQLHALVQHIAHVAQLAGINRLPGPWLPPLPDELTPLDTIRPPEGWNGRDWAPASVWLAPVVGLLDDPANQSQHPLRIDLGKEGHLALYGAPGSGKTTFLQVLAVSLAMSHSPGDVQIYVMDFGGRTLSLLDAFPHVGAVIAADEPDRSARLLSHLHREMEVRKGLLATVGVTTIGAYRRTGRSLPDVVLLLDNLPGFAAAQPDGEDSLVPLAREGGNLGVHLVITVNSPTFMRARMGSNITLAATLQLTDKSDYSVLGRTGGLEPSPVPGRGLVKGNPPLEFQTAVPAPGQTEADRTAAVRRLGAQMHAAWKGALPSPIVSLPESVALSRMVELSGCWPNVRGPARVPVGVATGTAQPLTIDLTDGPHFLIGGPEQSGKTTFVQNWLLALAATMSPDHLLLQLVDFGDGGLSPLQGLPHVLPGAYIAGVEQFTESLSVLSHELQRRRKAAEEERRQNGGVIDQRAFIAQFPALVMAIDSFEAFCDATEESQRDQLEQLIRRERNLGFHLIVAGSVADLVSASWGGLVKAMKELQTGFLFGTTDPGDLQLLNLRLGGDGRSLAPGQGVFGRRGRVTRFIGASPTVGSDTVTGWVKAVIRRGEGEP